MKMILQVPRHTVLELWWTRRAGHALHLLEQARRCNRLRDVPVEDRVTFWRLLGTSLSECGLLRRSAEAFKHMLYIMQSHGIQPSSADWSPLAAVYRELWRSTGRPYYYRLYLRFTCEQTDWEQAALAYRALRWWHDKSSRCPHHRSVRT